MSLLDDLRSLDVSEIVAARGALSGAVQVPAIRDAVGSGPAASALGPLGASLGGLSVTVPDGEALLRPLADAFGPLTAQFDTDGLPLAELSAAIGEGLEFVTALSASFTGEPADFGRILGTSLEDAMQVVGDRAGEAGALLGAGADAFAALSGGAVPGDVAGTVELAVGLLLPLPQATLAAGRTSLASLSAGAAALRLPADRTAGLVLALDRLAEADSVAELEAALANLAQVRAHTLGVLRGDLAFVAGQARQLRPSALLAPLVDAGRTLRAGGDDVIAYLDEFRGAIAGLRQSVTNPDLDAARAWLAALAPMMEAKVRENIEAPIDRAVAVTADFLRRKLRELPVRPLRAQVTSFLHEVAGRIEEAGLDAPARIAREALATVARELDPARLADAVGDALAELDAALHALLDGIIDALDTIVARVDALAGEAVAILGRLAAGLAQFRAAIDEIAAAIAGLGIEQARDMMIDRLRELRQTVATLLSDVPLPEPLRPQVEQLAQMIADVDLDAAFAPVREVAEQLRMPAAIADTVEEGLAEAARVVGNLIPATLAEELSAEVADVLATVGGFSPAALLPDMTQYLEQAALAVERLDPRPAAAIVRPPFQAALDAFDRVHPDRLLAPVISAYDTLLGRIPALEGETVVRGLRGAFDAAGTVAGRAVVEPAARAAGGEGGAQVADPQAGSAAPVPDLPPAPGEVRAGDAIRLIGAIPARLRDALRALDAGPVGEVIDTLDGLGAGLAAELRGVAALLADVQRRLDAELAALLRGVGTAQLRAQFAVQARWGGDAVRLDLSIDALRATGPGTLRGELQAGLDDLGAAGRALFADAGGIGAELERLADALGGSPLARLGGDLNALLAALDPEPLAAEIDGLVADMLAMTPTLATELLPDVRAFVTRAQAIINRFNPGTQAQKFAAVLDVVQEELALFDPRRLAAELAEIHGVLRTTLLAYDPASLADELYAVVETIAAGLRAIDPAALLGDITFLQDAADRLGAADPGARLAAIGTQLTAVGEELRAIDLDALTAAVDTIGPRLVDSFETLIDALRDEIVALLAALRFATGSASGSVSVGGGGV